jgi:hypothetical protein
VKKRANREVGLFGTNPKCERCSKECKQFLNTKPLKCRFVGIPSLANDAQMPQKSTEMAKEAVGNG